MNKRRCSLYIITPPVLRPSIFSEMLAAALDAGHVGALQLRLKGSDDDTIRRAIEKLMPVAESRNVPFIMNDRPDLAVEMGCGGVHIGQRDAAYKEARSVVGDDAIVGVTCHDSRHFALEAADAGADYVAFGAFFQSGTKTPEFRATQEILTWWDEFFFQIPCVAIGGINADNGAPLVQAGANFLAVVGAVWDHLDGPAAGVRALNAMISAADIQIN